MSWLKTAFSKAAEAGGKNLGPNLSKTVKSYAGSVYLQAGQAVAGGAKIVQDRLSGRNLNNFKHAVRRLDEVALVARGEERKQALVRWLGALKDIDNEFNQPLKRTESVNSQSDGSVSPHTSIDEDPGNSPRRASMVLFYDADTGGEPLNFRDVFLRSHALENIVTSLILEAPTAEEVEMLLEIFGLCFTGGNELHLAIVSSIQELAKAASTYVDEVLIKKEELLQMARDAVSGLKLNPEVERLDAEISALQHQIAEKEGPDGLNENLSTDPPSVGLEPNPAADIVLLQVRLRQCLQKKSSAQQGGDSPKDRAIRVQKLKELTVALSSSSEEIQKLLIENQRQKEEAMNYRDTKAKEVTEVEKIVAAEVRELDKRRQELEDELNEVKVLLAAATARHIHTQEEKEQFDEASSNIIAHLSLKEEEMSRSVSSRTSEEHVVSHWVKFLEESWVLQSTSVEKSIKDTEAAWEKSKEHFFQISSINLSHRKEEANVFLKRMKALAEELEISKQKKANMIELGEDEAVIGDFLKEMRTTQNGYLETEAQMEKLFKWVAQLEEEVRVYQSADDGSKSEAENKLMQSFDSLAVLRRDFDALQRPEFEVEKVEKRAMQQGRAIFEKARAQVIETGDKLRAVTSMKHNTETSPVDEKNSLQTEESMTLSLPSEDPDDVTSGEDPAQGEIDGREFDELEEDGATDGKDK